MISEKLNMDKKDVIILTMLQKDPSLSQEELAKKLNVSQPSVSARIRKLRQKGIIKNIIGMNLKEVGLHVAKVDIDTTDANAIVKEFSLCPFFLNGFLTSGKYNLCLFFVASDLPKLDWIVSHHLRKHPQVKDLEMNIAISPLFDWVVPINIAEDSDMCSQNCPNC